MVASGHVVRRYLRATRARSPVQEHPDSQGRGVGLPDVRDDDLHLPVQHLHALQAGNPPLRHRVRVRGLGGGRRSKLLRAGEPIDRFELVAHSPRGYQHLRADYLVVHHRAGTALGAQTRGQRRRGCSQEEGLPLPRRDLVLGRPLPDAENGRVVHRLPRAGDRVPRNPRARDTFPVQRGLPDQQRPIPIPQLRR